MLKGKKKRSIYFVGGRRFPATRAWGAVVVPMRQDRTEPGLATLSPSLSSNTHPQCLSLWPELWPEVEERMNVWRDGLVDTEGARVPFSPQRASMGG